MISESRGRVIERAPMAQLAIFNFINPLICWVASTKRFRCRRPRKKMPAILFSVFCPPRPLRQNIGGLA
jgi:hypothetical protein